MMNCKMGFSTNKSGNAVVAGDGKLEFLLSFSK